MRVLIFTPMYPSEDDPHNGTFIFDEVAALRDILDDAKVLYINTRKSKLNYFTALSLLKKTIKDFQPDIVHCHHTFCAFIAWLGGFNNMVLTFHEGEYIASQRYLTLIKREGLGKFLALSKTFKRFCFRRVRYIFDVTGALKDWKNVTSPFSPGVNPEIFHPIDQQMSRRRLSWDLEGKYILFPGNPNNICKRHDIALKILSLVRSMLKAPVRMFPLSDIPHNNVPVYMSASDVMLLVSDYEASPMVVKEAVACGLPSVCYNVGDVSIVLRNVPNSFVIRSDEEKAAKLIKNILEKPFCERKNYLPERYSIKHVAENIISVYRNLLRRESCE